MRIFIIFVLIQWTTVWLTVAALNGTKEAPFLVIEPITSPEYGLYVIKKVHEFLNLTCTVVDHSDDMEHKYNVSWSIPSSSTNSQNRVVIQSSENSVNLMVTHLENRDAGEYACRANSVDGKHEPLSEIVRVNIKNRKKACGDRMFVCSSSILQNCIPWRFTCDGYQDCQEGEDEDSEVCGSSPCQDKLQCEDPLTTVVRCIPESWCCNERTDENCTVKEPLSCCNSPYQKGYLGEGNYFGTQRHYTDMSALQATVYTVIGCAVVFMIVVTVLFVAICRVHIKRSSTGTQSLANVTPSSHPQNTTLCDVDLYLTRGWLVDTMPPQGCQVTYNINNGVQIVGHAIDPPPYCEVVLMPPREGPPPPYSSCEALDQSEAEALLQQPHGLTIEDERPRRVGDESTEAETTGVPSTCSNMATTSA